MTEWIGPLFKDEELEPDSTGDANSDESKKKLYIDDEIVIEKEWVLSRGISLLAFLT